MATEPDESNDTATPVPTSSPIRHQHGRDYRPADDASADEAASQQQQ